VGKRSRPTTPAHRYGYPVERSRKRRFSRVQWVERHSDALSALREGNPLVIVSSAGMAKRLEFMCPCDCKERVSLYVGRGGGRAWRIRLEEGRLSVTPSIQRQTGCRSHFFILRSQALLLVRGSRDMAIEEDSELPRRTTR